MDVHRAFTSASLAPLGKWKISWGDGFLLDGNGKCFGSLVALELANPLEAAAPGGLLDEGRFSLKLLLPEHRAQDRQSEESHLKFPGNDEEAGGSITGERARRRWRNGRKELVPALNPYSENGGRGASTDHIGRIMLTVTRQGLFRSAKGKIRGFRKRVKFGFADLEFVNTTED